MKAIMILAFVLIGMIGQAQGVEVNVDSIQVGDEIVFKKECHIVDLYNNYLVFPKGYSFVVTDVFYTDGGTLLYINTVDDNGETKSVDTNEFKEEGKRIKICR